VEDQPTKSETGPWLKWLYLLFWVLESASLGSIVFAWTQFHPHLDWAISPAAGRVRIPKWLWMVILIAPLLLLLLCLPRREVLGWKTELGTWTGLIALAWALMASVVSR
jgi:hypothetical protein